MKRTLVRVKRAFFETFAFLILLVGCHADTMPSHKCGPKLSVQVLGSGGPIRDGKRAASGYLIRVDGKARYLIDLGPGVMHRFAQSGARISDLHLIALTHLHVDHSADLSALAKEAAFLRRDASLSLVGPSGNELFPSLDVFVERFFGPEGAYRYLGSFFTEQASFSIRPQTFDAVARDASHLSLPDGRLSIIGADHHKVPALAFRFEIDGKRIVFTGDQTMREDVFINFARHADLLVAHHAISNTTGGPASRLHAKPSDIAALARRAGVRRVLLSHHMKRSLVNLDANVAEIQRAFAGDVIVANDLICVDFSEQK